MSEQSYFVFQKGKYKRPLTKLDLSPIGLKSYK